MPEKVDLLQRELTYKQHWKAGVKCVLT